MSIVFVRSSRLSCRPSASFSCGLSALLPRIARRRLCAAPPAPGSLEAAKAKLRAARAPPAEEGAAAAPTLLQRVIPVGLWALLSLNVGAFLSAGDEGVQILIHLDEFSAAILAPETGRRELSERLERVSRGVSQNDSLKLGVLRTHGMTERLLCLLTADVAPSSRNHAAKVLEHVGSIPEAQLEMVARGVHERVLAVLRDPSSSLYIKKTLATLACHLASAPANLPALARAGAVSALHDEQESSAKLRRKKVEVALRRLCAQLSADEHAALLAALPARERELITRHAKAEAAAAAEGGRMHALRATMLESGVLLYLHTAAGGAAWGLFESLRLAQPMPALVQNVVRTALVTCFVPILLVGGVVSTYNTTNRTTDTVEEKFAMYFSASLALYPARYLLEWVERFAPLWLGGHIVGFVSFFAWTLYTESDLLKSDAALLDKSDADTLTGAPR